MGAEGKLNLVDSVHVRGDSMSKSIFQGELVRFVVPEPELAAGLFSKWSRDSEFIHLLDAEPARLFSVEKYKEWFEKHFIEEQKNDELFFLIHSLEEDRAIGLIGLDGIRWVHGEAWVDIGLGERDYWGKGYGSDAMRVLLRYAFAELNLHRLSLSVFEYNTRAIRAYEKSGFTVEGRARQFLNRGGQRYDLIFMGLLRREWERR
jgi:RimJ/RimL family protein N-acetyltransferase